MSRAAAGIGVLGVLLVACAAGCSGGSSGNGGCLPGASLLCACTDGRMGAQICQPGGTLGMCVCAPVGSDGGGATTGSGGDGGAGGAGAGGMGGGSAGAGGAGGGAADARPDATDAPPDATDARVDAADARIDTSGPTGAGGSGNGGAGGGGSGGTGAGGQSGAGGTSVVDAGAGGAGTGGSGTGGADAGADRPPTVVPVNRQIFSGLALLIGNGQNACTRQVPASGDRWCGFVRPGAAQGSVELWVANVSRAATGVQLRCDGSDANCIRLTTSPFIDPDLIVSIDGFDGDTLIYYAETGPTYNPALGAGFIGSVYAWRPGWTAGRKLTSDTGVFCQGQGRAAVAVCFDNQVLGTSTLTYDLHVGPLPAAGGPTLPRIETTLVATSADPSGVSKFQFDFSPDGAYLGWSARPTATGVETLKVLRIGDAAPTTVAADVSRWRVSPDGARWYWLRSFNYSTDGAPAGTLQAATFPGGGSPITLAGGVGEYEIAGARGVMFRDGFTGGKGNLKLIADRDAFAAVTTLDTGVAGVADVSQDGRRAMYFKNLDSVNQVSDLYIATAGAAGPCTLSAAIVAAPLGSFLSSGGGALWALFDVLTGNPSGVFTRVDACSSNTFAPNILTWQPVGDEGFIYGDDAPADGSVVTLRYSKVAADGTLARGPAIQQLADPTFASLLPALAAVVFVADVQGAQGGVWVSSPLPFTASAP